MAIVAWQGRSEVAGGLRCVLCGMRLTAAGASVGAVVAGRGAVFMCTAHLHKSQERYYFGAWLAFWAGQRKAKRLEAHP